MTVCYFRFCIKMYRGNTSLKLIWDLNWKKRNETLSGLLPYQAVVYFCHLQVLQTAYCGISLSIFSTFSHSLCCQATLRNCYCWNKTLLTSVNAPSQNGQYYCIPTCSIDSGMYDFSRAVRPSSLISEPYSM